MKKLNKCLLIKAVIFFVGLVKMYNIYDVLLEIRMFGYSRFYFANSAIREDVALPYFIIAKTDLAVIFSMNVRLNQMKKYESDFFKRNVQDI